MTLASSTLEKHRKHLVYRTFLPHPSPNSVPCQKWLPFTPGNVAELHGDALCHAPLLREHASVLLLVVHQLSFDPGVPPVDLVQPGDLEQSVISFHPITAGKCGAYTRRFPIDTHILVFLEQHQVLGKVLPDELFDDLLFDARVQHVRHQAGVSQHVTGATWSLRVVKMTSFTQSFRDDKDTNIYEREYLGTLRGERFFEIRQNLRAQLTLSCLDSKQTKNLITLTYLL